MDVRLYSTNQSNKKRELKRGKSIPLTKLLLFSLFVQHGMSDQTKSTMQCISLYLLSKRSEVCKFVRYSQYSQSTHQQKRHVSLYYIILLYFDLCNVKNDRQKYTTLSEQFHIQILKSKKEAKQTSSTYTNTSPLTYLASYRHLHKQWRD